MKYYLHDSNAFNDEKITELYMEFGYEGLGLFYTILEKLSQQEKPVKTAVLKKQLNIGKRLEKCWCFMEEIELISSNNGETFNKQLLNFSEKYAIKKEKNRKRISEWRVNQADTESVTRYESVRNTHKVNRSKVNRSKVNKIDTVVSTEIEISEPITEQPNPVKFNFKTALIALGVESQIAVDWIKVRKAKGATNTETAFNAIEKQIFQSGIQANECVKLCVEKSWAGFKSEWLDNLEQKQQFNLKSNGVSQQQQQQQQRRKNEACSWDELQAVIDAGFGK